MNSFEKYYPYSVDTSNLNFLDILELCNVMSYGETTEICSTLEKAFTEKSNLSKKDCTLLLHSLFKECDLENEYRDILLSFRDSLKE